MLLSFCCILSLSFSLSLSLSLFYFRKFRESAHLLNYPSGVLEFFNVRMIVLMSEASKSTHGHSLYLSFYFPSPSPSPFFLSLPQEHIDHWNCKMFSLESLTDQPLRYMGYDLFRRHRLMQEYKVTRRLFAIAIVIVMNTF